MKKAIIIAYLMLIAAIAVNAQQSEFPKLTGPYLGQKPPGIVPEIFAPDIISTALSEGPPSFMPEGGEFVYSIVYLKPHSGIKSCIIICKEEEGKWTTPEVLFPGVKYDDLYPFISYDGKWLFFQSNRPTNKPDLKNKYNIWASKRLEGGWGKSEPLPFPINGKGDVSGPSMSKTGEFFFTFMSGKSEDGIYKSNYSDGKFSVPERLPENVNIKEAAFDGVVSPDGRYYLVSVYGKEDTFGATDLYVSFKDDNGNWTPLKNLGKEINTPQNDGGITISPDGKYIFFAGCLVSNNFYNSVISYKDILDYQTKPQYGNSDIYWVSAKIIEEYRQEKLNSNE